MLLCVVLSIAIFLDRYKAQSTPDHRNRLRIVTAGLVIGLFFILPLVVQAIHVVLTAGGWSYVQSSPWLLAGLLPIPLTFAYAVVKHRVLDIDVLAFRIIVFLTSAAAVAMVVTLTQV